MLLPGMQHTHVIRGRRQREHIALHTHQSYFRSWGCSSHPQLLVNGSPVISPAETDRSALHCLPGLGSGRVPAPGALLLLTLCKFHELHFTTPCFLFVLPGKGKTTPKKLLLCNLEGPNSSLKFTCSKLSISSHSALHFSWWTVQNRVYLHEQSRLKTSV